MPILGSTCSGLLRISFAGDDAYGRRTRLEYFRRLMLHTIMTPKSGSLETSSAAAPLILITGATGYVGGRLLLALERDGKRIRCLARRPEYLKPKVATTTEVVAGDVLDRTTLDAAMAGVDIAYYLVHSMGTAGSFEENDRLAAKNFAEAAKAAGVKRIIYLGALGDDTKKLSPHLASRQEVGHILHDSGVQVIEFRASIVIGSGSLSFEMIRSLVERLPIMVIPKWAAMPAQPIAIEDLIAYLIGALDFASEESKIFEIGGSDIVSYAEIMRAYARSRGMKVRMISVPVLTPFISSLWLGLITPLYARIGRKLIQSIVHSTIVRDASALKAFSIRPIGIAEALNRALVNEEREFATTRWSDALSSSGELRRWGGVRFGTRLVDSRTTSIPVSPQRAFRPVERIGGETGWYAWDSLWELRGLMDLIVGGVGTRRGRPSNRRLRIGDTLDFWRVEAFEPDRLLRLSAEMKVPGRAWLEFEVSSDGAISTLRQTAIFDPLGFWGLAYWYLLYPIHQVIFKSMLHNMARVAVEQIA